MVGDRAGATPTCYQADRRAHGHDEGPDLAYTFDRSRAFQQYNVNAGYNMDMDILSTHALGTAGWLAIQSLPLIVTPSLVTTLMSREPHKITDLESYLCRSLGLVLLLVALLQLLLTGLVPLSVGQRVGINTSSSSAAKAPYQRASLTICTIYFALAAFYAYTQLTRGFIFAFGIGLLGDVVLFGLGLWVLLFGSEKPKISKSTGADKRTSAWPFANKESASEIKKKERESRSSSRRSILKSR